MAGLMTGDLILQVDQRPIRDTGHLMRMIAGSLSGSSVLLDVVRGDERLEMRIELGTRPPEFNRLLRPTPR